MSVTSPGVEGIELQDGHVSSVYVFALKHRNFSMQVSALWRFFIQVVPVFLTCSQAVKTWSKPIDSCHDMTVTSIVHLSALLATTESSPHVQTRHVSHHVNLPFKLFSHTFLSPSTGRSVAELSMRQTQVYFNDLYPSPAKDHTCNATNEDMLFCLNSYRFRQFHAKGGRFRIGGLMFQNQLPLLGQ